MPKRTSKRDCNQIKRLNLFATILTYAAPSANHHNKGDDNNKVLQTISRQGRDYPTISPYAIRDALRRILHEEGLPCNRTRVKTAGAPQVEYRAFSNAEKYIDDFFFGFCITDKKAIPANPDLPPKRDSIFKNNLAVGLSSDINIHLQQAPRNTENSPWNNISETTLLYRQVSYTAYQYPFALLGSECISKPDWTKALVKAIGELSGVAGGNSVSHIQMAPRSIIARLTSRRVPGYDTYGFNQEGEYKELDRLISNELPGKEFWLGGEIVRQLPEESKQQLEANGVKLRNNPETLLEEISQQFLAEEEQ
ncbi:MAG: type I-B CRISPR-associated protein Cas7/Cst2/DevR [Cyanobacteria bacterium J06621_8]